MIADPLAAGAVQLTAMLPLLFTTAVTAVGAPGNAASVWLVDAAEAEPVPITFVAVTVKVYAVPRVSPTMVAGLLAGVVPVQPPQAGDGITVYWLIAAPLVAGAVQLTAMLPLVFTEAVTAVGAPGGSAGVTGLDDADDAPVPITLVAFTVKVYAVPRVSPTTVALVVVEVTPVHPEHAGDGLTVYPVIADPLVAGAVQLTVTVPVLLATPLTAPGAPGGSAGMTAPDAADAVPVPTELVAVTVKVYEVPRVSPTTVVDADAEVIPVQPPQVGLAVTVYWVIVEPLLAGAVQERFTVPLALAVPLTEVGAPGAVAGMTPADAAEMGPAPEELVGVTLKVYDVPRVKPPTVVEAAAGLPVTVNPVHVPHAGDGVTAYWVMVDPLLAGALQESPTVPLLLAVADGVPGVPGTPMAVTAPEAVEALPVKLSVLVAVTVKVYDWPGVRPPTVVDAVGGLPLTDSPVHDPHAGDGTTE